VLKLLGDPYFMTLHEEWKPAPLNGAPAFPYELSVLLLPVVLGLSKRRPTPVELGLTVLWLHLALTGFRYGPIWVLVAAPVMARASYKIPWVAAMVDKHLTSAEPSGLFARREGPAPWGVWTFAFAVLLVGGMRPLEGRFARLLPQVVATDAL